MNRLKRLIHRLENGKPIGLFLLGGILLFYSWLIAGLLMDLNISSWYSVPFMLLGVFGLAMIRQAGYNAARIELKRKRYPIQESYLTDEDFASIDLVELLDDEPKLTDTQY